MMMKLEQNRIYGSIAGALIGDALGWPQERPKKLLNKNDEPKSKIAFKTWNRRGGSRFNAYEEEIKSGEYSDDSQLLLATARSLLKGEKWSRFLCGIELPIWLLYERGSGRTISQAAKSWEKSLVPWNQENKFIEDYFHSGANGAAMRVLPHSLFSGINTWELLDQVMLNSILTHGHPRAILGALIYAAATRYLITKTNTLQYSELIDFLLDNKNEWSELRKWNNTYEQWIMSAQNVFKNEYEQIWNKTVLEIVEGLMLSKKHMDEGAIASTEAFLKNIGAFDSKTNGSGVVASLAAIFIFSYYVNDPVTGMLEAAFANGADTDTLASMTGGLFGVFLGTEWIHSEWEDYQDKDYVKELSFDIFNYPNNTVLNNNFGKQWNQSDTNKVLTELLSTVDNRISIGHFGECTIREKLELKPIVKKWKHLRWTILTEQGQRIYVTKQLSQEVKNTSKVDNANSISKQLEVKLKAILEILSIHFDISIPWEFLYNNKKIKAIILDSNFQDRINCGEEIFARGDKFLAELKIANSDNKSEYQIIKIIDHYSNNIEPKLTFKE